MVNSYIIIPGDITGKKIRTNKKTEDGNNVEEIITRRASTDAPIPEHKTYFLYGNTSAATDDLTPTKGKSLRIYGFYGAYHVDSAFAPSVAGSLAFGTGGLTDKTKILGVAGEMEGARAIIFTMTPMNRLGAVNEVLRFTMPTYSPGTTEANFIILYNEE